MTLFFVGLSLGLLINRQGKKPLLRFPLRCWFFGHSIDTVAAADHGDVCKRCQSYVYAREENTFWTL